MVQAEDELLLLWSSVEKDKAAVMERSRQLLAARGGAATPLAAPLQPSAAEAQQVAAAPQPAAGAGAGGGSGGELVEGQGGVKGDSATGALRLEAVAGDAASASAADSGANGAATAVAAQAERQQAPGCASGSGVGGAPKLITEVDEFLVHDSRRSTASCFTDAGDGTGPGPLREDDWLGDTLLPHGQPRSGGSALGHSGGVSARGGSGGAGASSAWGGWRHHRRRATLTAPLAPGAGPDGGGGGGADPHHHQYEPGREPHFLSTLYHMLADVLAVARGPERRAFGIAAGLAVLNQASGSTSIINYAPEVLASRLGVTSTSAAILYPIVISITKCLGVGVSLAVVDSLGRRPLLISGGAGCSIALLAAVIAVGLSSVPAYLLSVCAFILSFSLSWAGLYWVVVSEMFSMAAKSPASSAATSLLFLTGALVDFVFLSMVEGMGQYAYLVFAAVAAGSAVYVWALLPETKERTLAEVQALLAVPLRGGGGGATGHSGAVASGGSQHGVASARPAGGEAAPLRSDLEYGSGSLHGGGSPHWSTTAWRRAFGGWGRPQQQARGGDDDARAGGVGGPGGGGLSIPLGVELAPQRGDRGRLDARLL